MITVIIIDDEERGRLVLRQKLGSYCPEVRILAEAGDGIEAISAIKEHKPQLIFLDIEMPKMNGFEMLNELSDRNFHIIFTTAYDQYAIKAIKYAAFDYLLKPIDIEELKTVVSKVQSQEYSQTKKQLELLQQNLQHSRKLLDRLAIPTMEGLIFFEVNDIIHLEAQSNYTIIHFANKTRMTVPKTLKEFEELLPEDTFFRVHHSHLINLTYIKRYIKGDGGQIELKNGTYVDVARRKKEEFLRAIGS